jgi:hypothetical protein
MLKPFLILSAVLLTGAFRVTPAGAAGRNSCSAGC